MSCGRDSGVFASAWFWQWPIACLLVASSPLEAGPVFSIPTGAAALSFEKDGATYGVALRASNGSAVYRQPHPLAVEVVDSAGVATWRTAAYSSITNMGAGRYECAGAVTSPNGSVFEFVDTFHAHDQAGAFEIDRSVRVSAAKKDDAGFSTRFTLQRSAVGPLSDFDFFLPSVWYRTNAGVGPRALAPTLADIAYWVREDRLPLPLFMLRDRRDGVTLAVIHQRPDGGTFSGEDFSSRIIDARMQFASLGMENNSQPSVGLLFPGTEGEHSLIWGGSGPAKWAYRSHPVRLGFTQTYSLVARLTVEPDFPTAMTRTWAAGFNLFHPAIYECDLNRIYANAVAVLSRYWTSVNGVPGEPFRIPWPTGLITDQGDVNYDMGFVGMQLPNAAILIREGFNRTNAAVRAHGEQMASWWAEHALTASGCPRTWFDPRPQTWRNYPTYIRVACDGMIGLLWAWNQERKHGVSRPAWAEASTHFGDWLLSKQNGDGSIALAFNFASNEVADPALDNTSHMVRYLTELHLATGEVRYRHAALAAGDYIYTHCYQRFSYVGGTADNPNVPDKEAASMALRAFTALYDLTGDRRWLAAAVQTAEYYATWIYAWNIPMPADDPGTVYPRARSTTGLSPIATGNSGCDSYAATDAFEFYRLYLFTGDTNLLNTAELMLYNTKQPLDWDPAHPLAGYGDPGIFPESLSLAPPRGHGVHYYLPWQTANYLEPMIELRDTFGEYGIREIEQQSLARRQAANQRYGRQRGYGVESD